MPAAGSRARRARGLILAAAALGQLSGAFAADAQHGHGAHGAMGQHGAHGAHRRFDDPAGYAQSWEDPARDAWQRPAALLAALGVGPGMEVADIGTGTGYLLPYLSAAVGPAGRVYAVDVSPEMLGWVRERAVREGLDNVATVAAGASDTGLPARVLDRAIMINVWHHVAEPAAYAAALYRNLREGAVLFVVETKPEAHHDGAGPPRHFRIPPEAVIAQFEAAGFRAQLDPFEIDRQYVIRATR